MILISASPLFDSPRWGAAPAESLCGRTRHCFLAVLSVTVGRSNPYRSCSRRNTAVTLMGVRLQGGGWQWMGVGVRVKQLKRHERWPHTSFLRKWPSATVRVTVWAQMKDALWILCWQNQPLVFRSLLDGDGISTVVCGTFHAMPWKWKEEEMREEAKRAI